MRSSRLSARRPLRTSRFERVLERFTRNFALNPDFGAAVAGRPSGDIFLTLIPRTTRLAATIKSRFTARDGFSSHYSNDLESWLTKPLRDWNHSELGTLVIAAIELAGADDHSESFDWRVYQQVTEREGFYTAWSNAVDWRKFEAKRDEKRADKLAELAEFDPELADKVAAQTPRCPDTPDLFA